MVAFYSKKVQENGKFPSKCFGCGFLARKNFVDFMDRFETDSAYWKDRDRAKSDLTVF